jgi:hypothetical protein
MNSATWLIFTRELGGYTRTISGYIIVALALFIDGILFNALALSAGEQRSAPCWPSSSSSPAASP